MTDEEKQQAKELFDGMCRRGDFRAVRRFLNHCADHGDEYAGLPMPIEGARMHIHPKYRWASIFNEHDKKEPAEDTASPDEPRYNICHEIRRGNVTHWILEDVATKRRSLYKVPGRSSLQLQLETLGIIDAWEVEAEGMAVQKLGTLLSHHQFRCYMLTGQFLETSERSKVHYLFRRLRPTLALSSTERLANPIAALCMHPIGYYQHTFGGSMVPTDDVVAHLMLMRGDEKEYWKQCNQHPPDAPEAAI